jgi:lipopolysaccharide/colanic/teichoic acid biosynthesis glycosyltransferase
LARAADPDAAYRSLIMPEKIEINLAYAARADLLTDIGVIVATLARLAVPGAARGHSPADRDRGSNQ